MCFFFKQKTAYEMRISDWSSDVCSSDLQRLVRRVHVDAGTGALGVLALEQVRDAAGELDHFQPALQVAARIRQHLAVLAVQQPRQRVHVALEQALELEQHPRAPLRVDLRPRPLAFDRACDRAVELGRVGEGRSEEHTSELQSLMRTSYA